MDDNHPLPPTMISGPHGALATLQREGGGPGLFWLGGYASDMRGTKAEAVDAYAHARGRAYCRFDYTGHGESAGDFEDGTISRWAEDAAHVLTTQTEGPQILIGSSMGGWIAGLLAQRLGDRVAGLVLLAPAPDFATELTPHQWPKDQWDTLQREGRIAIPSDIDESDMVYTKAMFDDGAKHRVLTQPLCVSGPVRILSGMKDDVVPWQHAVRYAEHIDSPDLTITLVKDGDHRLSTPSDIARLHTTLDEVLA